MSLKNRISPKKKRKKLKVLLESKKALKSIEASNGISTIIYKIANILKIKPHFLFDLLIHHVSRFYRGIIDNKLVVLGAINGTAFIGNTKYIYNYLNKNTDFKLVWFSKSQKLTTRLKKEQVNVINTGFKAIKILRKARFIFVTHGITDVLPIRLSPKTIFVETWHGVQNKRNRTEGEDYIYPRLTKILRLKTRNNDIITYFITPSGTKRDLDLITKHFEIPLEKVIVTGYPRNDFLFSNDVTFINALRKNYKIPQDIKKIFLYAPTFRDKELIANFNLTPEELNKLNEVLKKNKYILLMKAHLAEKTINFKNFSHMLNVKQEEDIQELLLISDCLITDYSSVYCDYLLLNRPILFFTPDYNHFMKYDRGFYYDFEKIAPGPLLFTGTALIDAIKNISEIDKKYEGKRMETRTIYHKYIDGN